MPFSKCFPCLNYQNEEIITKLDYSNTTLIDVFPDVWQYERTLEELYLNSARISHLPPQLFYCQNLRVLVISNNNLEALPETIGSLRQLQHLNLSRNLVFNIPTSIKSCKNLTHLDLSCNNLQRLPDAITSLISLQELLLNETYLEFLPANFGRLVHLRILELRLNNLITLPKSLGRLSNLQRIDIGGNEFTELPDVVGELKQLRELWIDFNQIRRISSNIAKLRELQHFEANNNLLDTLPNVLSNWRNIEVLSICTNNLECLPLGMGILKSLVTLKCEFNGLQELPDSISNLENLEELVLSHNQLKVLPPSIGMLRKLRFLFVDNNDLHALPEEICSCISLSLLSVSRNKIIELPQNIGHLTNLKVLNIVKNCIKSLPVSVLSLVNLTSLWISDNQSQPLVPLQYLDPIRKTELTCFMLPQTDSSTTHQSIDRMTSQVPQHQPIDRMTSDSASVVTMSPSKRICFAEEATILSVNASSNDSDTNTYKRSSNVSKDPSESFIIDDDHNNYGVRLMRSPTPYPKELRLMAKYLRNSQKFQQRPSPEHFKIRQARIVSNTQHQNQCDTNNINCDGVIQLSVADDGMNALSNSINNYNRSDPSDVFYPLNRSESRVGGVPAFLNNDDITDGNIGNRQQPPLQNGMILQGFQLAQSLPVNSIMEPPPYHIARGYTKKSPEDLTEYDTIRKQNMLDTIPPTNELMAIGKEMTNDEHFAIEVNSNNGLVEYRNAAIDENDMDYNNLTTDHQNNILNTQEASWNDSGLSQLLMNQNKVKLQNGNILTEYNMPESSLNQTATDGYAGEKSSSTNKRNTTGWLFGVHKNPTVKQLTLKCDQDVGFEITQSSVEGGIFVSMILPHSHASRLLCINDKLLEVDGYDFSSMSLSDAKKVILNAIPNLNIMLSRK